MKKLLLSLLIVHSAFAPAMNEPSLLSRIVSIFSFSSSSSKSSACSQQPNESELIKKLRVDKARFAIQLIYEQVEQWFIPSALLLFSNNDFKTDPIKFLQYCYYQKLHKNDMTIVKLEKLKKDSILLKYCQNARIDGYSALGAAMIAKDISLHERREFIQKLIDYNFMPTDADIQLAELIFYDETAAHHGKLIHFLKYARRDVLPEDIRNHIIHYVIHLLKEDKWPLFKNKTNTTQQINATQYRQIGGIPFL